LSPRKLEFLFWRRVGSDIASAPLHARATNGEITGLDVDLFDGRWLGRLITRDFVDIEPHLARTVPLLLSRSFPRVSSMAKKRVSQHSELVGKE
jgi:hypothetical protein